MFLAGFCGRDLDVIERSNALGPAAKHGVMLLAPDTLPRGF